MSQKFAKFILNRILGWHSPDTSAVPENRAVILGVPHTSIYDFVVGYLFYRSVGGKMRTMIKKEAFFFPLGVLFRSLGAFPMDRKHPQAMLKNLIEEMEASEKFHLVICPEGTRKAVHKWKTGYHTIARDTGAALYLGYFDYATRTLGFKKCPFELTEDARGDTDAIQMEYERMGLTAKHPSGYTTR